MNLPAAQRDRLLFLCRVIERELAHLQATHGRLFAQPLTLQQVQSLDANHDLAERIEAFVSRFGRLQDNLGDKLLPQLLRLVEEPVGAAIDNIDRAERLGWIASADQWLNTRRLRNQMVLEYIEDAEVFLDALQTAHSLVPMVAATARSMLQQVSFRLGQP